MKVNQIYRVLLAMALVLACTPGIGYARYVCDGNGQCQWQGPVRTAVDVVTPRATVSVQRTTAPHTTVTTRSVTRRGGDGLFPRRRARVQARRGGRHASVSSASAQQSYNAAPTLQASAPDLQPGEYIVPGSYREWTTTTAAPETGPQFTARMDALGLSADDDCECYEQGYQDGLNAARRSDRPSTEEAANEKRPPTFAVMRTPVTPTFAVARSEPAVLPASPNILLAYR